MTPEPDRLEKPATLPLLVGALSALLVVTPPLRADDPAKPPKLFASEQTLAVTLTAPWNEIQGNEEYQGEYPGQIQYAEASGATTTLNLTVERRGIKRQDICGFPPIKLRFAKDTVKNTTFRGQKSLKLVTHCDKSKRFDQYVVLEMLAYRMYNLLTEASFRVRPLEATYIDNDSGKIEDTRFAFLIEDDSDVAKRNDSKKMDVGKIPVGRLQPEQTGLMALYQYMIGNVDWAATAGPDPAECCHNVKLIGQEPMGADNYVVPLPYDFDSAGLVDAHYAVPPDGLSINSVTQRLYRGYCLHNDTLDSARAQLRSQRAAFDALIANEPRLTARSKKKASRYIDGYFATDADDDRFKKYVIERCRK